jgi:hypothetical protein
VLLKCDFMLDNWFPFFFICVDDVQIPFDFVFISLGET